jgi:hypothetical protein
LQSATNGFHLGTLFASIVIKVLATVIAGDEVVLLLKVIVI